jgi:hypothetical protein
MIFIDQIAELTAESIKAASLTPLRECNHRDVGSRPSPATGRGERAGPDLNGYDAVQAGAKQAWTS